jgi:ABC-type nitrate/sulfonate/bicarbonate transport system permease component
MEFDIQHAMVVRGEVARGSVIPEREAQPRKAGPSAAGDFLLPLASVAAALALWEAVTRAGLISQNDLPAMSTTMQELWSLMQTGEFWKSFGYTVRGWALGILIATVLAVPFGILLGASELAGRAFRVPIEFLRPIPSAVLIPLLFLTLGPSLKSEVFLAAFGAFWPLLVQTIYGVRDVDPVATDTARSFGVGSLERLYRITLPSAMPYIATGLRISSTVSLILAFTAELFMGTPGLGQAMNYAQSYGLNDQLYALAIATGFLGLAVHFVMAGLERRVLHWHPSQRGGTA